MAKFDADKIRDGSDFNARFKKIETRLRQLETSSGLESASFSGQLRIASGGSLLVDGGGGITVNGEGDIRVGENGSFIGEAGSAIRLNHRTRGQAALIFGETPMASGDSIVGLWTGDNENGRRIFEASESRDHGRRIYLGDHDVDTEVTTLSDDVRMPSLPVKPVGLATVAVVIDPVTGNLYRAS